MQVCFLKLFVSLHAHVLSWIQPWGTELTVTNEVERIYGAPWCWAAKNEECLRKKHRGLVVCFFFFFLILVKANFEEMCLRNFFWLWKSPSVQLKKNYDFLRDTVMKMCPG